MKSLTIQSNQKNKGVRMKVVSFVNMKGGVAKTTLAVNVAVALARRADKKVLLIDIDPQFNATQCLVNGEKYIEERNKGLHTTLNIFEDAPPNFVSLPNGSKKPEKLELKDISPLEIEKGLDLMPGSLELYRLDMGVGQGKEQRLKRYLAAIEASKKYDYVIIDTPPTPSVWMFSALLASDYYLIPLKPEPLSWTGIDLLQGVINQCSENFAHPLKCAGIVLTMAEETTIVYKSTLVFLEKGAWKGKRFKASLPKRTKIANMQAYQRKILDSDDATAKSAIINIANEFISKVI